MTSYGHLGGLKPPVNRLLFSNLSMLSTKKTSKYLLMAVSERNPPVAGGFRAKCHEVGSTCMLWCHHFILLYFQSSLWLMWLPCPYSLELRQSHGNKHTDTHHVRRTNHILYSKHYSLCVPRRKPLSWWPFLHKCCQYVHVSCSWIENHNTAKQNCVYSI